MMKTPPKSNYCNRYQTWWFFQDVSHFKSGIILDIYLDVSENNGTPKSSVLMGVFHSFHHPFWGFSPYFWKHPYQNSRSVHPGRLTWNRIMEVWKIIFFSKWVICRFHVNLPGCNGNGFSPSIYPPPKHHHFGPTSAPRTAHAESTACGAHAWRAGGSGSWKRNGGRSP